MPPNTSVRADRAAQRRRAGHHAHARRTAEPARSPRDAGAAPSRAARTEVPRLGLTLAPAADVAGSGSEGVVITNVEPGSIAAEHGFRTGDVILNIANKPVTTPAEVRDMIADAQKGGARNVLVRVKSGDSIRFVAVRLGRA